MGSQSWTQLNNFHSTSQSSYTKERGLKDLKINISQLQMEWRLNVYLLNARSLVLSLASPKEDILESLENWSQKGGRNLIQRFSPLQNNRFFLCSFLKQI